MEVLKSTTNNTEKTYNVIKNTIIEVIKKNPLPVYYTDSDILFRHIDVTKLTVRLLLFMYCVQ